MARADVELTVDKVFFEVGALPPAWKVVVVFDVFAVGVALALHAPVVAASLVLVVWFFLMGWAFGADK